MSRRRRSGPTTSWSTSARPASTRSTRWSATASSSSSSSTSGPSSSATTSSGVITQVGRRRPRLQGRRRGLRPTTRPAHRHLRRADRHRRRRRRPQAALAVLRGGRRGPARGAGRVAGPGRRRRRHSRARRSWSTPVPAASARRSSRSPSTSARTSPPRRTPTTSTRSAPSAPTRSSTTPSRTSPTSSPATTSCSTPSAAANLEKSLTVLKPGGLAISVVGPPDPAFARQLGQPLLQAGHGSAEPQDPRARPRSSACATRSSSCRPTAPSSTTLAALYDDGTLRPVLDRTFAFDQTLDAMAYVEQGKAERQDRGDPMTCRVSGGVVLVTGAERRPRYRLVRQAPRARGDQGLRHREDAEEPGTIPVSFRCALDATSIDSIIEAAAVATDVTVWSTTPAARQRSHRDGRASPDLSRQLFDVNFFGPLAVADAFAPALAANGGGALLNVLSVLSWIGVGDGYSATKAALWSATKHAAAGTRRERHRRDRPARGLHRHADDRGSRRLRRTIRPTSSRRRTTAWRPAPTGARRRGLESGPERALAGPITALYPQLARAGP